jgi:hemoglobin
MISTTMNMGDSERGMTAAHATPETVARAQEPSLSAGPQPLNDPGTAAVSRTRQPGEPRPFALRTLLDVTTQLRTGNWTPTETDTPYQRLGGSDGVLALTEAFYDAMEAHHPELAKLHQLDERAKVSRGMRDRFGLFLIGWLGGPQDYMAKHGHPRLRMRHARVPVDAHMRDAWLDSMRLAMDARRVDGEVRSFLDARFAEVADFLRNTQ